MANQNPFITHNFRKPKFFCGRKEELKGALSRIRNGKNLFITSNNSIGKTSFLMNIFYHLGKTKEYNLLYVNLGAERDYELIFNPIKDSVVRKFNKSQKKGDEIKKILANEKTANTIPNSNPEKARQPLSILTELLSFINEQNKTTIFAIDDFDSGIRSIENFEEMIQKLFISFKNIQTIFIGKQVIESISKEDILFLEAIPKSTYRKFIAKIFLDSGKVIKLKSITKILNWTKCDTFATQLICSRLWESNRKKIDISSIGNIIDQLLQDYGYVFSTMRKLLTSYQWKLLSAIAKEDEAFKVTSTSFIEKYRLNAPSSVKTGLKSLISKDLIYRVGDSYQVSNVILQHWIKNN